jgi:hypothetical protein
MSTLKERLAALEDGRRRLAWDMRKMKDKKKLAQMKKHGENITKDIKRLKASEK